MFLQWTVDLHLISNSSQYRSSELWVYAIYAEMFYTSL